ncbi:MAG TPA: hypothetical protein VFB90_02570 [Dehalococcoidia bacterium]|nr:hypothetical protein [Dehalococcoidia bacterium]
MLANPGFESGTGGWHSSVSLSTSSDSHSGAYAGLLTPGSGAAEAYQAVAVAAGSTYDAVAWLKPQGNVSLAYIRVSWYDGSGSLLGRFSSDPIAASSSTWQAASIDSLVSPAGAATARFSVVGSADASPASLLIDDASFQGDPAPPTPPSPTPVPPDPPSATPGPPGPPYPRPPSPPPSGGPDPTSQPGPAPSGDAPAPVAPEPTVFGTLVNGSFEEARTDGTPYGWQKFGGQFAGSTIAADGARSVALTSSSTAVKWVYQTVSVQAGAAYQLAALAYKNDPGVAEVYLRISWYDTPDASGPLLESADSLESLTSDAPWFRVLDTGPVIAPATARSARLRMMLYPAGSGPATAYFDAVTFYPTMAPLPAEQPPRPRATSHGPSDPDGPAAAQTASGSNNGDPAAAATGTGTQVRSITGSIYNDRTNDAGPIGTTAAGNGSLVVVLAALGSGLGLAAGGAAYWGLRRKIARP